jgi:hypothetical protein
MGVIVDEDEGVSAFAMGWGLTTFVGLVLVYATGDVNQIHLFAFIGIAVGLGAREHVKRTTDQDGLIAA